MFYERYHHNYYRPINLPQTHFPSGRKPPSHTSPSLVSQYNNSILPHSFPTESISPATTCSEEHIDTQELVQ
jgi:hypothetical protein